MKYLFYVLLLSTLLFSDIFKNRFLFDYIIKTNCSQILHKKAFDICYSYEYRTPKLVIYKLRYIKKSIHKRFNFKTDKKIPYKYRNFISYYKKSGYDRGHLAPNKAFSYNINIQKETFLSSNIVPQNPYLNRYIIKKIELKYLKKAKNNNIIIITGVTGTIGKLKNKINIPKYIYKMIFLNNKLHKIYIFNNKTKDMNIYNKYTNKIKKILNINLLKKD